MKCERCHDEYDSFELQRIKYFKRDQIIHLCDFCYSFIKDRFDDVIEEYILRKE